MDWNSHLRWHSLKQVRWQYRLLPWARLRTRGVQSAKRLTWKVTLELERCSQQSRRWISRPQDLRQLMSKHYLKSVVIHIPQVTQSTSAVLRVCTEWLEVLETWGGWMDFSSRGCYYLVYIKCYQTRFIGVFWEWLPDIRSLRHLNQRVQTGWFVLKSHLSELLFDLLWALLNPAGFKVEAAAAEHHNGGGFSGHAKSLSSNGGSWIHSYLLLVII